MNSRMDVDISLVSCLKKAFETYNLDDSIRLWLQCSKICPAVFSSRYSFIRDSLVPKIVKKLSHELRYAPYHCYSSESARKGKECDPCHHSQLVYKFYCIACQKVCYSVFCAMKYTGTIRCFAKDGRSESGFDLVALFGQLGGKHYELMSLFDFNDIFRPTLDNEYDKYRRVKNRYLKDHYENLCCFPAPHPSDKSKVIHFVK